MAQRPAVPLAVALHQELLTHDVFHADETPLIVLNTKTKKVERQFIWVYVGGENTDSVLALFDY